MTDHLLPPGSTLHQSSPRAQHVRHQLRAKNVENAGCAGLNQLSMYHMENTKNKQEIIEELKAIIKANEKNIYCDEYQLADMIKRLFKDYDVHF